MFDLACAGRLRARSRSPITSGFASQTVLPSNSSGSAPVAPSALKHPASGIYRAIHRNAVALANREIVLTVTRRGMHGACALIEGHVFASSPLSRDRETDGERLLFPVSCPENGRERSYPSRALRLTCGSNPSATIVDATGVSTATYSYFWMKTDREISWNGPGRSGPDQTENLAPGQSRIKRRRIASQFEAYVNRGAGWFSYSTSASASAVRSLMHQCTGFSPL